MLGIAIQKILPILQSFLMNKIILLNLAWLVACVGAFVIGKQATSNTASQASQQVDGNAAGRSLIPGEKADPNATAAALKGAWPNPTGEAPPWWLMKDGVLSDKDITRAMEEVMSMSDPIERALLFSQLMNKLTPENAEAAYAALRSKANGFEAAQSMGLFAYAWGSIDATKAMASMEENGGRMGGIMKGPILGGWASSDPDAAIAWMADQEDNGEKTRMSRGLIAGLARTDTAKATEYVTSLGEDGQGRYVGVIASEEMKKGIGSAEEWALGLESDQLKTDAMEEVARTYARQDLDKAADWVLNHTDDATSKDAVAEVANELTERSLKDGDMSSTIEWVSDLPDGAVKDEAMNEMFREWGQTEPGGASEYLNDLPDSPTKDYAVSAFAKEISREDPEVAMQWATSIQDEASRVSTLESTARSWYRQDQEAAQQWIEQSNLPQESVEKITAPPERSNRGDFFSRFRNR